LKKDYPSYINVPTLLIDIVSVMGVLAITVCFTQLIFFTVAFIPEGLPVAVTLSLAKVANTLSKHKVLCK
jgi:sodium/potassium-transporting ATPase subunit alpha